ncbi:hypothetical protein [Bifidobacterium sp. ESL0732]|uniref:hypothetical protein n=1 Tax=Bifidobacterium sp. ESL0732 TaxID=2983222 RepID=UPI0023F6BA9F|nr:hypothetical protein [Bifidobacterium sp. ESL0732]WEV64336.1 hypothetical protein OZX70_01705 [Bifidobacterium sp. ESL0732]
MSVLPFLHAYLRNASFRFQVAFRLRSRGGKITRIVGLVLWILNLTRHRIQIPCNTEIGHGLYIGHAGPVVVSPDAQIGDNVNLSQFTTIGSNEGCAARIGNAVYIGPDVCVVENVSIGDEATIGAGSVVTKDIPAKATAAGNYAKVLNYKNPGRYIKNRWKI